MAGFERHIREAIELNRRRAPLYAAASQGASRPISRGLVRAERVLLPFARWLDRRALRYDRAGTPILDDLFVSMSTVPEFSARVPAYPPPRLSPDLRALRRSLRGRVSGIPDAEVTAALQREIDRLAAEPHYWCMLRHLLESLRRIAAFAPHHEAEARAAGLPSPLWIHRLLFRGHIAVLGAALRLDRRALPLQQRGIPILCRDLPPIPPP